MMGKTMLTILMPCLNEAETLLFCINEAKQFIKSSGIAAEILIADNGSTDNSIEIATAAGARVIVEEKRGYGYAVRAGIQAAEGKYIIMGDCDGSYDFTKLQPFVEKMEVGFALVVGNRLHAEMEKKAMPFLHRYIGVPGLSYLAAKRFGIDCVQDFHCGLRGFYADVAKKLPFSTGGMEFATEMIAEFARTGVDICEVQIRFRKDKRSGNSHLRTFRDGWRHMWYIMKKRK